jgi:hypothetical protein
VLDASKKPPDASPADRWMADILLSSLVLPVRASGTQALSAVPDTIAV